MPKLTSIKSLLQSLSASFLLTITSLCYASELTPAEIARVASQSTVEIEVLNRGEVFSTGTGFIVDSSGLIVTNYHVIEDGDELRVRLDSGEEFRRVFVLSHSERFDLAIIKISSAELPALRLGSSASLRAGDEIFVLSNPLGLARSFSQGHVSARRVLDGVELLQISAPISSGSSGGAVLNTEGEVVGVATAMLMDGQNINMAMPIKYVKGLLSEPSEAITYQEFGLQQWGDAETLSNETQRVNELSPLVRQWIEELGFNLADYREALQSFDEYDQELVFQLMLSSAVLFSESGYEDYHLGDTVGLYQGEVTSTELDMERGQYIAVAACDRDCGEMFITVQSDSGWLAGSDSGSDLPQALFSISESKKVKLRLRMMQCATEPCFAKLLILRQ